VVSDELFPLLILLGTLLPLTLCGAVINLQ